jgi:hypothetical protein
MSGGKASGSKQNEDRGDDAALLALHLTQRGATLLFAMTVSHGATDSQIAHAIMRSTKASLISLIPVTIVKIEGLASSLRRKGTMPRASTLISRERRNA